MGTYAKMAKKDLIAMLEERDSQAQASKTTRKPKASKPKGPSKFKLAMDSRKAENIARGYNSQATRICPQGHLGADGTPKFGIQADWTCGKCGEVQVLEFTAKLPKPKARK